ncbi:MAG TPA: DUF3857 domain-containing protein [Thermoanaerobaculia bacterium]|nr:DUF3857 domain-containing protein [Thermoanaerobaculia bacterium]
MTFRLSAAALLAALAFPLLAADPWDSAPFASEPKALLAAAESVPAGEAGAVILLDEATHTFDENGCSVSTQRLLLRIIDESAVEGWGAVNAPWAPWIHERPLIRARVVTKDGTVHELDANAITEAPAPEESLDIFSDNRVIRAPLPAVAVGSVIEELITYKSKESLYDAASSDVFFVGGYYPVHRARLVVDAPASLALKFVNQAKIEPRREERDGRQHIVFEGGPFVPRTDLEWDLPYDVSLLPWVGVSNAKSWQELAKRYAEIVEKQIADADLAKEAREVWGTGNPACRDKKDRQDCLSSTVAKALAWIQKRVRYAGVEVGESSVVPRPPRTVLANRYGDCKDKATLLVALLRQAGVKAHVALLRAGNDFDVPRELPGLGMFNHAIVIVEGDLWVDPTDEFARAGELPIMDQGRLALIASAETAGPVTTPMYDSIANRVVETRTVTLPEEGKAALVELSEASGADESSMRRYYVSSDRKRYRESIEEYVKSYYSAKSLAKLEAGDPHDLTKPFHIRVEASEAARGISMDGEAAVAIFPSGLLDNLPWSLRDFDSNPDDDEAAKAKKRRKNDFVFHRPFVREWRYRIVPPPGFVARTLPANETVRLGTTTLAKTYATEADGTVLATFRFDSGKRRLSPAEVDETKKAVSELDRSNAIMIGFDQKGALELANGNISAALAEFRKLAAMHPKEGRHQTEIARALLAGGMGEAAREQIKKAITLEPGYARAHRMQGIILQHDLFGRPFRRGFDLKAAIAAYRKAKELDPKDESIRAELAKLLQWGEEGLLFGRNANFEDAIAEYKALIGEMEKKEYEGDLYLAYALGRRFGELKDALPAASNPAQQHFWRVVLAGATDGAKAAIREASSEDQAQRKQVLRNAASILLSLRMYTTAADLLEEATQGAPSAEARQQIEGLRKARRFDEAPLPKDDPKSIVKRLVTEGIVSELSAEQAASYFAADERPYFGEAQQREWHTTRVALLNVARKQGLPLEFYADVGLGAMQVTQDGDDATGYRIRLRTPAVSGTREETLFVVREGDEYKISGTRRSPALIGFSVLRLLDAGKTDVARQWLNWTREDFPAGGGDDPLATTPFSKYWPKNKPSASVEEMRVAAAMLMPSKELGDRALPILTAAREKASSDEERLRIDHAIAITHTLREDYAALLPVVERLAEAAPDSAVAFNQRNAALTRLDRPADVAKLANERLARIPKDEDALRALGGAAMSSGDYAACDRYYRQVIDELRPTSGDYNNIAWNALLSGANLDRALEDARQAMQLPGAGPALLHTLASLYAETGKSLEAREALLQSMDDAGREEPADHDWYVLGRIAENYGAKDAALAAYRRVEKPKTGLASSTFVLAERRVKGLR